MIRYGTRVHSTLPAVGVMTILIAAVLLFASGPVTAEVVRNSGGASSGVDRVALICEITPDYNAVKGPDVDPVFVVGISAKDDTGGLNPARIARVAYDNGVDPLIQIDRGSMQGLTPAHEELDNLQVNRLELWALPFLPVPATDQGVPLKFRLTFMDHNGDLTSVSDVVAGCGLFNGVSQDRPVIGHGGGDIGWPGTDTPFSLLPCSVDGIAVDALAVNADIDIVGPVLPGQTPGVDEATGVDEHALRARSSFKVTDDENCVDGLTWMVWELAQDTTWVTAALTLEPEEDCYVSMKLGATEIRPGEGLQVDFRLQHNRWQPVTVPVTFWIEDAFGDRVLEVVTAPRTFDHGDRMKKTFVLHIPDDLAPGAYFVVAGAERMQQGFGWTRRAFEVVDN